MLLCMVVCCVTVPSFKDNINDINTRVVFGVGCPLAGHWMDEPTHHACLLDCDVTDELGQAGEDCVCVLVVNTWVKTGSWFCNMVFLAYNGPWVPSPCSSSTTIVWWT